MNTKKGLCAMRPKFVHQIVHKGKFHLIIHYLVPRLQRHMSAVKAVVPYEK